MANALRIQPLEDRVYGNNGVILQPLEACERISLRAEDKAIAGLGKAIGLALPKKPGTSSEKNGIIAMWIGPDEWFVTAPEGTGLEAKIDKVKTGLYSAVSINHRNTGLTISGKNAVNALNSGCPRDLSLTVFPVGACSRTMIAKAEVILYRTDEQEFRVECWRSFSDYVWKYLMDAARSA
ncbi:MAG: sarcosine oxidase subunit gamma [Rhizobiaceae bacterium]|nr:sarcosine oxidase subunit gamma [Rhizobiaceae bacterium]